MPGPTTEVLNEDIKELKVDIRDVRGNVELLKNDTHRIAISLAELRAEFNFAKGLLGLLLVATISGIGGGIWWTATITADMKALEVRIDDKFKTTDLRNDDRYKSLEARFDKIEAALSKLLEQSKATPKTPAG